MHNFDPYNVFLAISINIPQRLNTAFVLQGHIYNFFHYVVLFQELAIRTVTLLRLQFNVKRSLTQWPLTNNQVFAPPLNCLTVWVIDISNYIRLSTALQLPVELIKSNLQYDFRSLVRENNSPLCTALFVDAGRFHCIAYIPQRQ